MSSRDNFIRNLYKCKFIPEKETIRVSLMTGMTDREEEFIGRLNENLDFRIVHPANKGQARKELTEINQG